MATALADRGVVAARDAGSSQGAPYPETLILDWTDYCNAKCFFCYREKYEQQIGGKGEFIPFSKLKKLERVLSSVKYFGISSGIGEPLLHPELDRILEWLYAINPKVLIRTTTNGTALTASKAALFANHIDWLSVSLNAGNGEAHMRDMFPHLAKGTVDATRRWELHLRHLREFIAALPLADRPRIRIQMVAHRHNVQDIPNFIRVVASVGASHAVITNIAAHSDTVDWSLFWIKDLYNDKIDEASVIGTQLGVKVDAVKFYTTVKPVLDLEKACHDPTRNAYISRANVGAPCCHWIEAGIPTDVYNDENGFDRYWNDDILRRLRLKRDFASCKVCGMSRVFDETSFHFSPHLKKDLVESGRLSEVNAIDDYPDAAVVRACVENRLDLPSIRRTLLGLELPIEMAAAIEGEGIAALPALEEACWRAFQKMNIPCGPVSVPLAGSFLGIGWGVAIHEPQNKLSARWIGGAQAASIFVRVAPDASHELRITIHHVAPAELALGLRVTVCGRPMKTRLSLGESGIIILSGFVSADLSRAHDGRLWVRIECLDDNGKSATGRVSLVAIEVAELNNVVERLETLIAERDALAAERDLIIAGRHSSSSKKQQKSVLERAGRGRSARSILSQLEQHVLGPLDSSAALEQQLQEVYKSRSWRLTAPLRAMMTWLRHLRLVG